MKCLIILTKNFGYNFTGATMATQKYIEIWSGFFDSILVITQNIGDYYKRENIEITRCSSVLSMITKCINVCKNKSDLIGYSDDHFGFLFKFSKISYIHTYHGNWPDAMQLNYVMKFKSLYFIPLYWLTIKYADTVVNVSEYMRKFTYKINKKSKLIHNGIDVKPAIVASVYKNTCLMVGNVDERKYKYLIPLLKKLKENDVEVNFHIFGKIIDQELADKLSCYDNVVLKGLIREIPYGAYKVFVNLSQIENLSISVCEAIINKIPVICFRVGGLPEVVKESRTGNVIEKFDIHALANALENAISMDFEGDPSILDDFDWRISASKYINIFRG